MAENLYKTMLFTDESKVIGLSASNSNDLANFINNYKSSAQAISNIHLNDTTYLIDTTYTLFKNQVLLWSSVRYIQSADGIYTLLLLKSI
jgi:hypothetical protein